MILSLKKSIFLLLFSVFQVLIFFTFYTTYQFIIFSLFLSFLLFYFWYFKLKVILDSKVFLLWFSLLFFLILSSIFTHSLPLSLENFIYFSSSFCIFTFFRSLGSSKLFSKSDIAVTFLLLGIVFSIFFIFFFIFTDINVYLPPMSIFTIQYGHSHFAAFLLFLIPITWWFVSSKEYDFFNHRKFLLVYFYTLLILTFGRFAILLSLFQIFFINKFVNQKSIKNLYLYIIGFTFMLFLIFSTIVSKNSIADCPVNKYKIQLCKPIIYEARPDYFKQAIESVKNYPLFGYGPGTFSLVTKKFNSSVHNSSILAHNSFLQIFSESGFFVGIIYTFLIGFLFMKMVSIVNNSKDNIKLNKFILIGLISLLINSLFDFDWELFPIFQMTLIFIALVFWDFSLEPIESNRGLKNLVYDNLTKYFWIALTVFLIILGVVNIITTVLITNNNSSLAFKTFPYFSFQAEHFLSDMSLSKFQRKSLYKIYENHPKFILKNIEETSDIDTKIELYENYINVKPSGVMNTNYYKLLLDSKKYYKLGEVSFEGLTLLVANEDKGEGRSYKDKKEIMDYLLLSIDNLERMGEHELSINYYSLVKKVWDRDNERF